jgi:pimeloyl-ACP methyl ester carboxylesterase
VVLLHGLASSFAHNWVEPGWFDLLTEAGRDVLTLDLPAHGPGPHETVPEAYADAPGLVRRRMLAAAPDARSFDAVGFSLGALTLLSLARAEPERYRRIALLGIGDGVVEPLRDAPAGHLRGDGPTGADLAEVFTAPDEPAEHTAGLFWRLARAAGNDPAALSAFVRRPRPPVEAADLARLTCPVLVVIGDRDTAYPADRLTAAIPGARLEVLRGTDHFGTTSDYRCLGLVLDFLAG